MYPMLREDVSLSKTKDQNSGKTRYFVKNGIEYRFEIGRSIYKALLDADGTKPLALPNKGKKIIPRLKRDRLIHTSRLVHLGSALFGFILFPIGNDVRKIRGLFRLLNSALPIASLLFFIAGLSVKLFGNTCGVYPENTRIIIWLYYLICWFSILLHEIGHMNAGIAYGYKVCSVGVLFIGILPIGAYVSCNEKMSYKKNFSSKEKIQFYLSGIESNIMMAGILLLASFVLDSYLSETLVMCANVNILLAILNSLPAMGLDGEKALSAFLGIDSIFFASLEWLLDKHRRKSLLRHGIVGYACSAFFGSILVTQILVVLYILSNYVLLIYEAVKYIL